MRLVAAILTLVSLAAAAVAGQALWQGIAAREAAGAVVTPAVRPAPQPPAPPAPVRRWPALFGERQPPAPPAPPAPPQAEPQPPPPPVPPLASLGYRLSGVVRSGEGVWAVVSHPAGQRLVRVGEALDTGVEVVAIDDAGVWLSRMGNPPELLAFPE